MTLNNFSVDHSSEAIKTFMAWSYIAIYNIVSIK